MKVYAVCRGHLLRYWPAALLALVAMGVQVAMTLLAPWPLKIVFDDVVGQHRLGGPLATLLSHLTGGRSETRLGLLGVMIAAMIAFALLLALASFVGGMLTASIGQRVVYALRLRIFDHMQRLSLSFYKTSRIGDLSARLTSDIQAIQDLVTSGLSNFITNSLSVVGILIIATIIDWHFALLMIGATPLLLFVAGSYRSRIRQAARELRSAEGRVGAIAQEKLNSMQVVQGFSSEAQEAREFARQTSRSLDAGLAVSRLQSELTPLVDLVGVVAVAAITWMGAREVLAGNLTTGSLLLFIMYFRAVLTPVRQLAKLSSQFSKAEASAERIEMVLRTEVDVRDLPGAHVAPRLRGGIAFEHVTFSYTPGTPVLRDVTFAARAGLMVALVGATGSGKSTLLSLIPRFADPQAGRVLVDGMNVREFTLRSLRDQVSLVFQEPVLFTGTIRDNIAYGRAGASDVEVLRAAQAANVHDFVMALPEGYATVLGERGGTLSGGQRQRIAIARALLRDAPLLLLDEPTTGLDVESEALVMEALYRLMAGRTTIVIAHRLRTIERADLILVLRDGGICERGTHQELLRAGGVYARWSAPHLNGHLTGSAPNPQLVSH